MTEASPILGGLLRIHKVISRALSVSIRKCDEYLGSQVIPPDQAAGFPMYVTTLKMMAHAHHLTEDEIAFPYFGGKLEAPYARLVADHQAMARILAELDRCVPDLSPGGLGRLRQTLGDLNLLWAPHIGIEEQHFTADKLNSLLPRPEQVKLAAEFDKHGRKHGGPGPLALPFLVYNLEGSDREAFLAPIPWPVKKVLMPVAWKRKWAPMLPFLLP